MFPEQFNKARNAALFVRRQVVMNVPAQVIPPELHVVFRPGTNDVIERVQTKILGLSQPKPQIRTTRLSLRATNAAGWVGGAG